MGLAGRLSKGLLLDNRRDDGPGSDDPGDAGGDREPVPEEDPA